MSTDSQPASEPVPREPSAYRPTCHFADRFNDRYDDYERHLDGEIIDGCITTGTLTRVSPEKCFLRETFAGVTYRLIVNPVAGTVLSGHPISINTEYARESDRWTERQVQDILEYLRDYDGPESR